MDQGNGEIFFFFSILASMDYQKVAFATYILEVDAKFWWNGMKRLLEES